MCDIGMWVFNVVHSKRILFFDENGFSSHPLPEHLTSQGFTVQKISGAGVIPQTIKPGEYDLVIYESDFLNETSLEKCQKLRNAFHGPIFILSDSNSAHVQIKAFELGFDDFVQKAVDPRVLAAKINARLKTHCPEKRPSKKIQFDNLIVDYTERGAWVKGNLLPLSTGEFELLWLLASHPKRALDREFLFVNALGRQYDGLDRAIDRHVSRLRRKLEARTELSITVRTVWGQGYMLAGSQSPQFNQRQ